MNLQLRVAQREEAATTFRRTSVELRKAITMIEDLEHIVGQAIALAGKAEAEQMLELQKLDHLSQKILGVADFIDALSNEMPPEWTLDAKRAARCVLLSELGAKLGDAEIAAAPPAPPTAPNNDPYELF